ncbi:MAG: single-stranded DNA-binding protein [Vampirovibrionales bacterium]|nr:single-stranded DNA-binding protein [Vampirovibrionales bacterium]
MSLARVSVMGTVEKAPETRFTTNQNVPVCNLILRVASSGKSTSGQPSPTFMLRVNCWRNLAASVSEQVEAGQTVWVEGRLILNSFQTPEGLQKKSFEVEASQVVVISGGVNPVVPQAITGGPAATATMAQQPASKQQPPAMAAVSAPQASTGYDAFDNADDIPF